MAEAVTTVVEDTRQQIVERQDPGAILYLAALIQDLVTRVEDLEAA